MDTGTLDSLRVRAIRARLDCDFSNASLLAYGIDGMSPGRLIDDIHDILDAPDPRRPDPVHAAYRAAAVEIYEREGSVEIDADATVSPGDDLGAYVAAWVWVGDDDAGICRECGEPNADNGEGWDGMCGNCADAAEDAA